MTLYLIKTRLKFTSNFVDQNNPKSKYDCKNELACVRDFEAVQKNSQSCIIRFKNSRRCREFFYLINTLLLAFKLYLILGCPTLINVHSNSLMTYLSSRYEKDRFVQEVHTDYVVLEETGRTDYRYTATMTEVRARDELAVFIEKCQILLVCIRRFH